MKVLDFFKRKQAGPAPAPAPEQADRASSPAEGAPAPGGARKHSLYIVVKGDSLSTIASGQYGDAQKWPRIYEANRDLIEDPGLVHPGQRLRIPE